jgi:hypothetical protein
MRPSWRGPLLVLPVPSSRREVSLFAAGCIDNLAMHQQKKRGVNDTQQND